MGGELFVMDDGWFGEKYPRLTDNADALQRIFMQWGTSYFFPAIAMASHISAVPNHAVFRTTSLKLRCDVAMSGRLGMEIQPKNMTDEEKAFCRQVISEYKKVRPVIQFGDLYRLHSPYKGDNMGVRDVCLSRQAEGGLLLVETGDIQESAYPARQNGRIGCRPYVHSA